MMDPTCPDCTIWVGHCTVRVFKRRIEYRYTMSMGCKLRMDAPCPRRRIFSSLNAWCGRIHTFSSGTGAFKPQDVYCKSSLGLALFLLFNLQGWLSRYRTRWIHCVFSEPVWRMDGWMDPPCPCGSNSPVTEDGFISALETVPGTGTLSLKLVDFCLLAMENGSTFSTVTVSGTGTGTKVRMLKENRV